MTYNTSCTQLKSENIFRNSEEKTVNVHLIGITTVNEI